MAVFCFLFWLEIAQCKSVSDNSEDLYKSYDERLEVSNTIDTMSIFNVVVRLQ